MNDDTVRRLEALVLELDDVDETIEASHEEQGHDEGRSAA